ncbi:hypothetical protein H2201_003008 [Coniosporium apollinis]|uniref:C2H2-type domain-containing protein n=1 Tax=Coniosporium apollinis TaxID=61459 RepID=A0ABQ9P022_9PEZI|nr:hypothetical protein H2201_003008 [Coniosporium apollinis]
MEDDADFNSSDLEAEPPANPHADLGGRAIMSMLNNAFEERKNSKFTVKNMTLTMGAPGTRHERDRWGNMFYAFFKDVLKKDKASQVPTGEDLVRFVARIPSHLGSTRDSGVPSCLYVQHGLKHVIMVLAFDHAAFTLDKRDRLRLSTTIDGLVKDGAITKDPTRAKQWVTAKLLTRLVSAHFQQAVTEGTRSWDAVISRALSLDLQAAFASRCGEVVRSQFYRGLECLRFEHCDVRAVGDPPKLVAKFDLLYEKGKKDDASTSRSVRIDAGEDPTLGVMCPVKLLLAHAMRIGAVASTTFEDLVAGARRQPDFAVVWTQPSWPVISAISSAGDRLLVGKPGCSKQMNDTLRKATDAAGMLDHVVSHDLRRGSARDLSHLSTTTSGVATASVAADMGHSYTARTKGLTQAYVGPKRDANWQKRLANSQTEEDPFGPDFAVKPYKKQRLDPKELTAFCEANGSDPSDRKARDVAAVQWHKMRRSQWVDQQRAGRAAPSEEPAPPLRQLKESEVNALPSCGQQTATIEDTTLDMGVDGETPALGGRYPEIDALDSVRFPYYETGRLATDESVEDQLALIAENADPNAAEDGVADDELSAFDTHVQRAIMGLDVSDEALDDVLQPEHASSRLAADLVADTTTFINFLAQINIVKTSKALRKKPHLTRGGSRAEPSPFVVHCSNAVHGCQASFNYGADLRAHALFCSTDPDVHAHRQAARSAFACTEDGCKASFGSREGLQAHERREHGGLTGGYKPKPCPDSDCNSSIVYETKSALMKHRHEAHSGWSPIRCPIEGCSNEHVFQNEQKLKDHLRLKHGLTGTQHLHSLTRCQKTPEVTLEATRPTPEATPAWQPCRCPVQGCTHRKGFTKKETLLNHLREKHGLKGDDLKRVFPWDKQRDPKPGWSPRKCPVEGCLNPLVYDKQHSLREHIRRKHGVKGDEALKYTT